MRTIVIAAVSAVALAAFSGCKPDAKTDITITPKNYNRQLPPGKLALRKLPAGEVPDFTMACDNMGGDLTASIANSIEYMNKPTSKKFFPYDDVTHDRALASLIAMQQIVGQHLSKDEANKLLHERFDCYISIGCDDQGTVLYTGYYTPIFDASPVKTDRFRYPLYKAPADLVKGPEGQIQGRRMPDGTIAKYPDRKTIESTNMLAGNELYYMADPFEVYIAHVQGSAKMRMPDGTLKTVGYAGNNGYDYESAAKALVSDKKIPAQDLSLRKMIEYFKAHPNEVAEYTGRNPRFVFFAETDTNPRGCLNEPVTPWRSIAADKSIFPRASVTFLQTKLYRDTGTGLIKLPYNGFACDQDAGGAIRAPGRSDIYMGVGERAGELAGRTQEEGRLYYLFLKPEFVSQYSTPAGPTPTSGPTVRPTPGPIAPPSKPPTGSTVIPARP